MMMRWRGVELWRLMGLGGAHKVLCGIHCNKQNGSLIKSQLETYIGWPGTDLSFNEHAVSYTGAACIHACIHA